MKLNALMRGLVGVVGLSAIVLGIHTATRIVSALTMWPSQFLHPVSYVAMSVTPLFLLALGLWPILRPPRRLVRLGAPSGETAGPDRAWAAVILRGLAMLVGVVILAIGASDVAKVAVQAVLFIRRSVVNIPSLSYTPFWGSLIAGLLRFGLGLYLLLGAPHLVRLQLRRLEEDVDSDTAEASN